jgi:cellobiose phosphorylase
MIAGKDAVCYGEAKNSWLTGTAAWTFVSVAEGLLGIKADYKGLKIDPCIPKAWKGFTATRKFRGVEYQIEVKNPSAICKGVKKVTVDGKAVAGNVIPFEAGKKVVKVEITLEA